MGEEITVNLPRIEVDLNDVSFDGTTRVHIGNLPAGVEVGRMVTAFESEDGVAAPAYVESIDVARGLVHLLVNRRAMYDETEPIATRLGDWVSRQGTASATSLPRMIVSATNAGISTATITRR